MNRPLNPQQVALAYQTDIGPVTQHSRLGGAAGVDGVYASFPVPAMAREIMLYAEHGVQPDAALMTILCGDLTGALAMGGPEVRAHLGDIAAWLFDNLPVAAQGMPPPCTNSTACTGKSHIYKEISPNSILISGGQTTVANLFYNLGRRTVGLVGLWDCVAFDEVAGITFKEKDGVQIMKDYMASGSFARGKDAVSAYASMVFVGNINQPVDTLVKTSHLLAPFPDAMIDSAFFDRFHAYIPGWEIPKMRPEFFTNQYGLIVDYLAEFFREMRKRTFGDAIDKFFKLGNNLNQRDTIAVRRTVSGLLKLLYPHEGYDKKAVRRCLEYALETRRRVKEQLKKIGGMEFYDVHFSYIDLETMDEKWVSVPEQGGGKIIPEGPLKPGVLHTVATGAAAHLGLYRFETQVTAGNGKLTTSGLGSNSGAKEAVKVAFDYFKANITRVSGTSKAGDHDFHLHIVELHNTGAAKAMTLASFVAFCSAIIQKPLQSQMVVLGDMSLGGVIAHRGGERLAPRLGI